MAVVKNVYIQACSVTDITRESEHDIYVSDLEYNAEA